LQNLLQLIAETLIKFQRKDGSFAWNLLDEHSRSDSSATAVFAWFFKEMNLKNAQKSLQYLQSVTQRSGAIDFLRRYQSNWSVFSKF
jgi:rhamnogalacturonyl hydrolase YesR